MNSSEHTNSLNRTEPSDRTLLKVVLKERIRFTRGCERQTRTGLCQRKSVEARWGAAEESQCLTPPGPAGRRLSAGPTPPPSPQRLANHPLPHELHSGSRVRSPRVTLVSQPGPGSRESSIAPIPLEAANSDLFAEPNAVVKLFHVRDDSEITHFRSVSYVTHRSAVTVARPRVYLNRPGDSIRNARFQRIAPAPRRTVTGIFFRAYFSEVRAVNRTVVNFLDGTVGTVTRRSVTVDSEQPGPTAEGPAGTRGTRLNSKPGRGPRRGRGPGPGILSRTARTQRGSRPPHPA
eukprot:764525-Hanusia_phi.AAC.3